MKKFFAVLLAALLPVAALAQTAPTAAMGAARSSLVGTYSGDLVGAKGGGGNFEVRIVRETDSTLEGTAVFNYALQACSGRTNTFTATKDGDEWVLKTKAPTPGCEADVRLRQLPDGKLESTSKLRGPYYLEWPILLTRK